MTLPTPSYAEVKANRKMRWWYEHLADFMMAHPQAKQNDIAAHFGRAPATISTIINSDAFKAYLRTRRASYAETLDATVRNKMLQVADQGFDLILDRFEKKRDSIPLEVLQKTVETALKGSGFGQNGPSTVVNVAPASQTVVPVAVSLADLQEAQQALRRAQQVPRLPEPEVVEAEFSEVKPPAEDLA